MRISLNYMLIRLALIFEWVRELPTLIIVLV
jgi:hypothetical protein